MPNYRFRNIETGEEFDELMPYSELASYVEEHTELERVMVFPHVNGVNSATFLEGKAPKSRKKAFQLEKDLADLKAVEYNTRPEDRGEIQQEIKELKKKRKAPIGANKGTKEQ